MQIFNNISNLLTKFYIYLQVTILVYNILIKDTCIINTPYGNKTIGPSRCIKRLSCNFILKSSFLLAKTEISSKDTMLSQTNIWSGTAEF